MLFVVTMDEEKERARARARMIAEEHYAQGDEYGWFEELYDSADGRIGDVPWADLAPNRFLVEWNEQFSEFDGESKKAVVVGCGLGDDAKYLRDLGYEVTAFDVSPSAIRWAEKLYGGEGIEFVTADLFDLPEEWIGAFDLVLEIYTVQALPLGLRERSVAAIRSLSAEHGEIIVVSRWRDEDVELEGPPWGFTRSELGLFEASGHRRISLEEFEDQDDDILRFVALYSR